MDSDREAFGFHPLYHVMMMGVCGSFLTGDLFNLFVWFEVLLISSFVLLALGGEKRQIVGAIKYVAINLVASSVFLSALGLLYGATGTLNMADLAVRVRDFEPAGFITALSMMFLAAFGVKAGVFPFFFWLPASYHTPPPVVSAVFAGLLTKVGVYALVRTFTLIFVTDPEFVHTVLLWVAGSTMVVGGLGAIAQDNFRRVLSFLLISHIGNMVLGLAFMTQAGLAATVYYTAHHMITKTALFLIAGTLALWFGTDRLDAQGGLFDRRRGMAILFLLAAFALAGIPPFSGFYGKVGLLQAATEQGQWALVAASVASSFLTLVAVLKLWNESFWRSGPKPGKIRAPLGPVAGLVGAGLLLGLAAGPAYQLADDTARQLMDTQSYIRAVLGDR
jgi:multicomponent Na+:H+ antiporter subunit D